VFNTRSTRHFSELSTIAIAALFTLGVSRMIKLGDDPVSSLIRLIASTSIVDFTCRNSGKKHRSHWSNTNDIHQVT